MKRETYDSQACKTLSSASWMNNRSVVLLFNYHDQKVLKDIERQVKGLKDKEKGSCPTSIFKYTQYMGVVDLSDQMYDSDQLGRRKKCRVQLKIFFGILDTGAVNFKITYEKMDFKAGMSAMDFYFYSMVEKFSIRKRPAPIESLFLYIYSQFAYQFPTAPPKKKQKKKQCFYLNHSK